MALTKLNFGGTQQALVAANIPIINSTSMPANSIIQTKMASSNGRKDSDSTSWTDTELISLTFDNTLQANSKVLVRFHTTTGEADLDGSWAAALFLSIFENSTNLGDDTLGLASAGMSWFGDSANAVYTSERASGELLFTPSVNNGTYTLRMRCMTAGKNRTVGATNSTHGNMARGNTQVVIQEIRG